MDRNEYLNMCAKASAKRARNGCAWWAVSWEKDELVLWQGSLYVPYAYRMSFNNGKAENIAIIRDLASNTEYNVPVNDIEGVQK